MKRTFAPLYGSCSMVLLIPLAVVIAPVHGTTGWLTALAPEVISLSAMDTWHVPVRIL